MVAAAATEDAAASDQSAAPIDDGIHRELDPLLVTDEQLDAAVGLGGLDRFPEDYMNAIDPPAGFRCGGEALTIQARGRYYRASDGAPTTPPDVLVWVYEFDDAQAAGAVLDAARPPEAGCAVEHLFNHHLELENEGLRPVPGADDGFVTLAIAERKLNGEDLDAPVRLCWLMARKAQHVALVRVLGPAASVTAEGCEHLAASAAGNLP